MGGIQLTADALWNCWMLAGSHQPLLSRQVQPAAIAGMPGVCSDAARPPAQPPVHLLAHPHLYQHRHQRV